MNMPAVCPSSPTTTPSARWLVLGATGFIGSHTIAALKTQGRTVVGLSRSTTPGLDILDRNRLRELLRKYQPTILLNACGPTPATSANLTDFFSRSTLAILEAAAMEVPVCRVVLLGSAAEYGHSEAPLGSLETDPLRPLSEYGRTKCRQFELAEQFSARGLAVTTARLFNPIGPGQGRHQLVGGLLNRIRQGERPLRVRQGNCIRDWLDVRDAARAIIMLAESNASPSVVNVCSGRGQTVEFIARAVAQQMQVEIDFEPLPASPTELARSVGNPTRIFSLGWQPHYDLNRTIADQCRHDA